MSKSIFYLLKGESRVDNPFVSFMTAGPLAREHGLSSRALKVVRKDGSYELL